MRFPTIQIDTSKHKVFFCSDHHFHHENVIEYCDRPFSTTAEMDRYMIDAWNSVVGDDDIVFHGGDLCFGSKVSWRYILDQLQGLKYLCAGNHDKNITAEHFIEVQQMFNILNAEDNQRITLCHYPLISWYHKERGAFNLYGHVHQNTPPNTHYAQLNICVDNVGFVPIEYNQIKELIAARKKAEESKQ